MHKYSLGFSSCPNDTFIFDALIHSKIESPYQFAPYIADVEELNLKAFSGTLDLTKISIHAWFHLLDKYALLPSGGALGRGCGPLLISKSKQEIRSGKIAIPGEHTTANLLFQLALEGDFEPVYMRFDKIMPAILSGEVDAGVIIHESRFTYKEQGLHKIIDLGEWWEKETGCPIPLGGILVSKEIERNKQIEFGKLIRQSIQYAKDNPSAPLDYIKEHAQELEEVVTTSHINLYVNDFSLDFGEEGKKAIQTLHQKFVEKGLAPAGQEVLQPDDFI